MAAPILSLILASLAFGLAAMAAWNSYLIRKLLRGHSVRSALEVSVQLAAHASALESLSTTVKRLSSRYGMRERRGANGQSQATELTGAEWKRQARLQFITPGRPVKHEGH